MLSGVIFPRNTLLAHQKVSFMKKLLLLGLIFGAVMTTSAYAQPSQPNHANQPAQPTVDKPAMLQKMKDMFRAPMVEKTGLTEAQVDRILEINLEIRVEAGAALQGLNEADRSKKLAEFKAEKEKRYAAIPLSADQIKSVYTFFEDFAKNAPQRN